MRKSRIVMFFPLLILACSSNTGNNPQPVTAPPYARLVIPTFPADSVSGLNRKAAVTAAAYWNSLADSLMNLRELLESAKNVTPSVVGDSEEVTWVLQHPPFTGTLKRIATDSATWELHATGPGLPHNALWATGKSTLDAQNGYWTVNNASLTPWLRVKFSAQDDSTVAEHIASKSYANYHTFDDTCTMTVGQKAPLPALWKTIIWRVSTGSGNLFDRMNGPTKCWGPKSDGYPDLGACP